MIGGPAAATVTALSDIGRVRSENQDRCEEFSRASGERLVVVADGMGGHKGGATAARIAIDTMGRVFAESSERGAALLGATIDAANLEVWHEAEIDDRLAGMGSTIVALLLGERDFIVHLGDSRAYRLRDGELELLTEDHSTVMELVRAGRISQDEAESHPRRNEVLRSLGASDIVEPEIQELETRPGDRYLLCSDGLTTVVPNAEIAAVLGTQRGSAAAQALVDAANDAGGPDNVTVAIVELPPLEEADSVNSATAEQGAGSRAPLIRQAPAVRRLARIAAVAAGLLILALAVLVASWFLRDSGGVDPGGGVRPQPPAGSPDPGLP